MSNIASFIAALHCPTKDEILDAAIALLPRGRAWQTNDGGPREGHEAAFQPRAFQGDAFPVDYERPSTLRRFWSAIAEVLEFVARRFCDLRLEFWCATQSETNDLWMKEYGLPDNCDPFPDLCVKVSAIGGARCEYFNHIIARMGWTVECIDGAGFCGFSAGCGFAGAAMPGASYGNTLELLVHLRESPAFTGDLHPPVEAGCLQAGATLACDQVDISPLQCLMDRIAPAHVAIKYVLT